MEESSVRRTFYVGADLSRGYYLNRPTYPTEVLDIIFAYMTSGYKEKEETIFNIAVDIGCGSGQATSALAKHFKKVIGCDVSETQVKEARLHNKLNNIEYHISAAEDMAFIPDGSVDLVICATAFHHMDKEKVYEEVNRVLHTNGVFAVYAYSPSIVLTRKLQEVFDENFKEIFDEAAQMKCDEELPMKDVKRRDDLILEWEVPMSCFFGFIQSLAVYRNWVIKNPNTNVLHSLKKRLKSVLPSQGVEDPLIHVTFPIFILMGRKA